MKVGVRGRVGADEDFNARIFVTVDVGVDVGIGVGVNFLPDDCSGLQLDMAILIASRLITNKHMITTLLCVLFIFSCRFRYAPDDRLKKLNYL